MPKAPRPTKAKVYRTHSVASTSVEGERRSRSKRATLKHAYGLTAESYTMLLFNAKHSCQACGTRELDLPKRSKGQRASLCVDHDHKTGKVRGLLCNGCNVALGHLKDDPERVRRLLVYIQGHGR